MPDHIVCNLDDIDDGHSAGFTAGHTMIMIIRQGNQVYAYENSCPHIGTPLDFLPDQFLTKERDYILCSTHGALFQIEDGRCVSGPCAGDALRPIAAAIEDGQIKISV